VRDAIVQGTVNIDAQNPKYAGFRPAIRLGMLLRMLKARVQLDFAVEDFRD
jgi:hypothetical protein